MLKSTIGGDVVFFELMNDAKPLGSSMNQPPDAGSIGVYFAAAIRPGATARAVSYLLGTPHTARERVLAEHALAAILTAEYQFFCAAFHQ